LLKVVKSKTRSRFDNFLKVVKSKIRRNRFDNFLKVVKSKTRSRFDNFLKVVKSKTRSLKVVKSSSFISICEFHRNFRTTGFLNHRDLGNLGY